MKKPLWTNFDEEIEKYPATPDWALIIGVGFLLGFAIVILLSL